MATREVDNTAIVAGLFAGIGSWVVGYALTYILVAPDIRESPIHQFIEAFEGGPATYEMVGWVFYNAHFVNTVFSDLPLVGSQTTSFIGGEDGFATVLYLLPAALLLAAGMGLARYHRATDPTTGLVRGLLCVPSYAILSIAGVFLFEVQIAGASGAPDLLPAVFLAGIIFPVIFGGGGGAIGGFLEQRNQAD